jgi:hypothetical protein
VGQSDGQIGQGQKWSEEGGSIKSRREEDMTDVGGKRRQRAVVS